MNRKAKVAYLYMIVGGIVFSVGFFLLLSLNLAEWYAKEKLAYQTTNHTQLVLVLRNLKYLSTSQNKNEIDENSYTDWYCLTSHRIPKYSPDDTGQLIVNNLNANIATRFYYTKKFFSLLICSSETINLLLTIVFVTSGSYLIFFGCFSFYVHEIKINQPKKTSKTDSNCQAGNFLETNTASFCFPSDEKKNKILNDDLKKNSIEDDESFKDSDNELKIFEKSEKNEKNCPYIYDDLPLFMYEAYKAYKSDEMSQEHLPQLPLTSPPPLFRNNIFVPVTSPGNINKYELVAYNVEDQLVRNPKVVSNQNVNEYFV